MEGNQYLHTTISKCIIIENSLGVAIYDHTYNIMQSLLVGKIYHTILDDGPFYRSFLVQDSCMPPSLSYILLYLHTYVWFSTPSACFRDMQQSTSGTCQTLWMAYLLKNMPFDAALNNTEALLNKI